MKNVLVNNEPILRAIEICRKGNFTMAVMFQDEITVRQRMEIWWFLAHYVNVRPIEYADLVLEYCAADAESLIKAHREEEVDFSYLLEFDRKSYRQVPDTLNEDGERLLRTAYERLQYEPRDMEIVLNVARCIAWMGCAEKIELIHLAEAINFRSFDRDLIVKNRTVWTAEQLQEILGLMAWKEEYANARYEKPFDELSSIGQSEWEGAMWGWQDAVKMLRSLLNLEPTQKLEFNPPSKSDWYICYVDGERMPLRYNASNDFWVGMDGKTYSSKTTIWINI